MGEADRIGRKIYEELIEQKNIVKGSNRGGIRDCIIAPAISKSSCVVLTICWNGWSTRLTDQTVEYIGLADGVENHYTSSYS